jgi:hypothetical protein
MTADERLALIWQKVERAPDRPLLRQRGDVLLDAAWLPLRQRNHFQEPAKSGLKQGCGPVVSDQTTSFDHVGVHHQPFLSSFASEKLGRRAVR